MRSTIGIDVAAPPELVFRLARDVERWPRLLPHYVAARGRSAARPDGALVVQMSSRRPLVPVLGLGAAGRLAGADLVRRADAPAAVRPPGGATDGMDVTWRIEPRGARLPGRDRARLPTARAAAGPPSSTAASPARSRARTLATFRDRRGDRAEVGRADDEPGMSDRRVLITGHRRRHRDRDRRRRRSGRACGPAARRSSGSTGSTRRRSARQVAAQVDDFDPLAWMPPKTARQLDRFSQFGLVAGTLALDDAGLRPGEDGAASPRADRDLPRQRARRHRLRRGAARAVPRERASAGRAEPRPRGVRRRGAGQPRDRARRPRADPLDRQLVRLRARSRSARRSGRSGPARSTRRSPAVSRSR